MEIIFKNVDYIYQPNTPFQRQALFDINLVIPHGKITSIIGNTGSGKSTLIKQINGLLKPTNGEISLGDKVINNNINSHDLLEIRRNVGMLFQFSERQLFSSTVAEDIKFGGVNYHLSPDELEHNFTDIINLLEIDNSLLNKSPLELSGGQMAEQYVTILTNPDYAKLFSYKPLNLKFRAVGLNCAASFVLTPDSLAGVESLYFTKNAVNKYHEQLDVEKYIDHNFLPTFLITANNDFLHDMQFTLFDFLLGRGVHAICKSYGDEDNPRGHVFFVNQKDRIADIANDEEIEFFRQHMSK